MPSEFPNDLNIYKKKNNRKKTPACCQDGNISFWGELFRATHWLRDLQFINDQRLSSQSAEALELSNYLKWVRGIVNKAFKESWSGVQFCTYLIPIIAINSHWFVLIFFQIWINPIHKRSFLAWVYIFIHFYYDSFVDTQCNPVDTEVTLCYLLHIFLNT